MSALWMDCKNSEPESKDIFSKKDTANVNTNFKITAMGSGIAKDPDPAIQGFEEAAAGGNNKYNHFDTILVRDLSRKLWKFDGGIDGAKNIAEKDMDGFWLEFTKNGKYTKGSYSNITSKGNYTVDNQGFIEMTPSNSSEKKSQWQSKFNSNMLILVGTPKYGDNQVQMRLSQVDEKPQKATK